jgi:hypothetical protein
MTQIVGAFWERSGRCASGPVGGCLRMCRYQPRRFPAGDTPKANLVVGMQGFQTTWTMRCDAWYRLNGNLFQGPDKAIPAQAAASVAGPPRVFVVTEGLR